MRRYYRKPLQAAKITRFAWWKLTRIRPFKVNDRPGCNLSRVVILVRKLLPVDLVALA